MMFKPDIKRKNAYTKVSNSMKSKIRENFVFPLLKKLMIFQVMFSPGYSKMTFIIDSFVSLWSISCFIVIDVITSHIVYFNNS